MIPRVSFFELNRAYRHHGHLGRYAERMVQHIEALLATWQDGQQLAIDSAMRSLAGEQA